MDSKALEKAIKDHDVEGVIHLAGFKYAGESVRRPLHTFEQNVTGTLVLLNAVHSAQIENFIFSSSASVYGTPHVEQVSESTPTQPESPYGDSKLFGEVMLRAAAAADGLRHTSLRYFNVVGSGSPDLYDTSPHNLFPIVFDVLYNGGTPRINGTDYATPDGTCVRDYVHVRDLAQAHVAAATRAVRKMPLDPVYNLGSGRGQSVREIMDQIRSNTGINFQPDLGPRRPGDPDRIVADGTAATRDLDWPAHHDLEDMVQSAWKAHQQASPSH